MRAELLALREGYDKGSTSQLEFCHKYLNFYIGLLSAIVAGTLTGLLSVKPGDMRGVALLIGPVLVLVLAWIGYLTIRVFYRRYVEAWVTVLNLEAMLGLKAPLPSSSAIEGLGAEPPPYRSRYGGGFIAQWDRKEIRSLIDDSVKQRWDAEKLVGEVVRIGDTRAYALWAFIAYGAAAVILAVVLMLVVTGVVADSSGSEPLVTAPRASLHG